MDYGIWVAMEPNIDFRRLDSIDELKESIVQVWNDLTQETIDKTIDAFRKRIRKVISVGGSSIQRYKL